MGREKSFHYAKSEVCETIGSYWLQGGMTSATTGNISSLIQNQQVKIDKLGRWIAQIVSNEKKEITIKTLHRMSQGKNQETQISISQYDQMGREMISTTKM